MDWRIFDEAVGASLAPSYPLRIIGPSGSGAPACKEAEVDLLIPCEYVVKDSISCSTPSELPPEVELGLDIRQLFSKKCDSLRSALTGLECVEDSDGNVEEILAVVLDDFHAR